MMDSDRHGQSYVPTALGVRVHVEVWLQRAPPPISHLKHEMEKKISIPTSNEAGSPIVRV